MTRPTASRSRPAPGSASRPKTRFGSAGPASTTSSEQHTLLDWRRASLRCAPSLFQPSLEILRIDFLRERLAACETPDVVEKQLVPPRAHAAARERRVPR